MAKKLVILSGPSGVGKGPLRKALKKYYPDLNYGELVLCNSRKPRYKPEKGIHEIHGVDYYFLSRGQFESLDSRRFVQGDVRSDKQAIDMDQVAELFSEYDLVLAEIYPSLGERLMQWAREQKDIQYEINTILLSPLSKEEMNLKVKETVQTPSKVVENLMVEKLTLRGTDSKEKIAERSALAYQEIQMCSKYTHQIVNHAGEEDLKEWGDPLGEEAKRVLEEFIEIIVN